MKFSTFKDEIITNKEKQKKKKLARTLWYQTRNGKFGMNSWMDRQTHTDRHRNVDVNTACVTSLTLSLRALFTLEV